MPSETVTDPSAPAQPATPGPDLEALRTIAKRMDARAEDGNCPSDCLAMSQFADEVRRWADELDAAPATYSLPECPGCAAMVKRWHRKAAAEGLNSADPPPVILGAACRECGGSPLSTAPPARTGAAGAYDSHAVLDAIRDEVRDAE